MSISKEWLAFLREQYPVGSRIKLREMKAGSMPRCEGCPYGRHGFICCGKDGRCIRTETARINHFQIPGEQDQGNRGIETDSPGPSGVEPTVPGGK